MAKKMKFTLLFNETVKLFPSTICIRKGNLLSDNGGYFPELSTAWDEAEIKAKEIGDWHSLMVWAIYGALHDQAISNFKNDLKEIETSKIDKNKAQSIFSESFYNPDGGYDSMHNDYENDIRP